MKLKAGNRYRRRDGQITGPLAKSGKTGFPFKDVQNNVVYTEKGRISEHYEYSFDLVNLYSEPTTTR